jgi:hypothetical protein
MLINKSNDKVIIIKCNVKKILSIFENIKRESKLFPYFCIIFQYNALLKTYLATLHLFLNK